MSGPGHPPGAGQTGPRPITGTTPPTRPARPRADTDRDRLPRPVPRLRPARHRQRPPRRRPRNTPATPTPASPPSPARSASSPRPRPARRSLLSTPARPCPDRARPVSRCRPARPGHPSPARAAADLAEPGPPRPHRHLHRRHTPIRRHLHHHRLTAWTNGHLVWITLDGQRETWPAADPAAAAARLAALAARHLGSRH